MLDNFKLALNKIPDQGQDWIIVDLFGGSGLLAHIAKRLKPNAKVIYNDFDNYEERLLHIEDTNRLIKDLYSTYHNVVPFKQRLDDYKDEIINKIKNFDGYLDIPTLGANLLFSSINATTWEHIEKNAFFNVITSGNYSAYEYLDGLEITRQNYDELIEQYKEYSKVMFIIDPPYIFTSQSAYKSEFNIEDLVKLISLITQNKNKFIMFGSSKFNYAQLMIALGKYPIDCEQLRDFNTYKGFGSTHGGGYYDDIMIDNS
ncbi:hypothetical protein CKF54_00960 [Psittacicella hinzii]|uniref:D12 class N6 adenine-specific DNA methyltransferase n=1 Tax=Psittacicella hinzii TaxID=2028575 RepID=A0A3A1Y7S0_9GAMM|nr:hypothetical protein [Psittacicella hinzii]RIY34343.1 hypothetical protein CKF54_00960 [Psittacicella hinzii]